MNKNQRNKLAMFKYVDKVFDDNTALVATIIALANAANKLKKMISEIENDFTIQESLSGNNTITKGKEQIAVAKGAALVAGLIASYAHENNLAELESKMSLSYSKLINMPDEKLESNCRNILNTGRKFLTKITEQGLTAELLDKLENQINVYLQLIPQPRTNVITRSQATRQLAENINAAHDLLKKRTDKLMLIFEDSEPTFYNTYKSARIIVDRGMHKTRNSNNQNNQVEE